MELTDTQRLALNKVLDFAATIDRLDRWAQAGLLTDKELRHDLHAACEDAGATIQTLLGAYAPAHV